MDIEWVKLILQAIGVMIWPVTVIIILIIFRKQISERLSALKKGELPGGVKFELGELKESVEQSSELAKRSIPSAMPSPADELVRTGDPLLAVANTRLEIEREIVRLAQVSFGPKEARKWGITRLIARLYEEKILSKETRDRLFDYTRITNQIIHTSGVSADDIVRSLSIGASLLAHIRYLYSVEWLIRDFDANLLWQCRKEEGRNKKYYFWSAIAATLSDFDYSYEAFCEAANKFNKKEEKRAIESHRRPREIYIPTLQEFLEILEFRREELQRILQGKWWDGYEWDKLREWHWPEEWGRIGWSGPIVRSRNEAEEELLRTDTAIERYSQQAMKI